VKRNKSFEGQRLADTHQPSVIKVVLWHTFKPDFNEPSPKNTQVSKTSD